MADALTGWRHLFSAVLALSTDGGPVDRRLRDAYRGSLQKIAPDNDLPSHLREEFDALMRELTDLFAADKKTTTSDRASFLAKKIVLLYDRVAKEL